MHPNSANSSIRNLKEKERKFEECAEGMKRLLGGGEVGNMEEADALVAKLIMK
ncbi:MAG: hypothetical protein QFX35_01035 [Candidatus Verstraetearchaeota archaeon]|nr:hypothetical protein [Candidatus Verstraetearchaeota archaeon]